MASLSTAWTIKAMNILLAQFHCQQFLSLCGPTSNSGGVWRGGSCSGSVMQLLLDNSWGPSCLEAHLGWRSKVLRSHSRRRMSSLHWEGIWGSWPIACVWPSQHGGCRVVRLIVQCLVSPRECPKGTVQKLGGLFWPSYRCDITIPYSPGWRNHNSPWLQGDGIQTPPFGRGNVKEFWDYVLNLPC